MEEKDEIIISLSDVCIMDIWSSFYMEELLAFCYVYDS